MNNPFMDELLLGLKREKLMIEMTDEMARRVGVDQERARRLLASEKATAKASGRPVDMVEVAWAIKNASEEK